jgi:hypothetical protein
LHKPEEETIIAAPLLPENTEGVSSTSRNTYVVALENIHHEFSPVAGLSQHLFVALLNNGEFLIFSEFD